MTIEQLIQQLDMDHPDWVIEFANDHEIRRFARHQFRGINSDYNLKWAVASRLFAIARATHAVLVANGDCKP